MQTRLVCLLIKITMDDCREILCIERCEIDSSSTGTTVTRCSDLLIATLCNVETVHQKKRDKTEEKEKRSEKLEIYFWFACWFNEKNSFAPQSL